MFMHGINKAFLSRVGRDLDGDVYILPGVGLMVRVVGLGSEDPEFKSHFVLN